MGVEKADLPVMRGTMLGFILGRYRQAFSRVILSCDKPRAFDFPDVTQVADEYPDGGPMSGLHAAFCKSDAAHIFLTAVDMPFSSPKLAAWLYDGIGGASGRALSHKGFIQPIFSVFSRSVLPEMERCLRAGKTSLYRFIQSIDAEILEAEALAARHPYAPEDLFFNINNPADYENALPLFKYYGETEKPVLCVVAESGTGKTTYLERLIPELKGRGIRLGVVKHDAHRLEIDVPGKDSWRITQAGADVVALSGPEKTAIIEQHEQPMSLNTLVGRMSGVDLILTEGYKRGFKPKIELYRAALGRAALCTDSELLAVVSDDNPAREVPVLPFAAIAAMADLIESFVTKFRPL